MLWRRRHQAKDERARSLDQQPSQHDPQVWAQQALDRTIHVSTFCGEISRARRTNGTANAASAATQRPNQIAVAGPETKRSLWYSDTDNTSTNMPALATQ